MINTIISELTKTPVWVCEGCPLPGHWPVVGLMTLVFASQREINDGSSDRMVSIVLAR